MTGSAKMIEQARGWIAQARRVTALTGAGISAESGIPTFRGAGGLWRTYKPEELATPQAFARDPKLVWEWYDWRRGLIAAADPNPGHFALVRLARHAEQFTLITQNVDGLHDRAGSTGILKVHGDIWDLRCSQCGLATVDRRVPLPALPPKCPECGALLRPGVVWFGESLPEGVWEQAVTAASRSDLMLVIGTSAAVYPAASLAPITQRAGAKIVEINIAASELSSAADIALRGPSGELLPELIPS